MESLFNTLQNHLRPLLMISFHSLINFTAYSKKSPTFFNCQTVGNTYWHKAQGTFGEYLPLSYCCSKIIPSFFTVKEGFFLPLRLSCKESSTFLTKPLFPQEREDVTALRCSEPLRSKVGGPSKVCARLCGLGPPGVGILNCLLM